MVKMTIRSHNRELKKGKIQVVNNERGAKVHKKLKWVKIALIISIILNTLLIVNKFI